MAPPRVGRPRCGGGSRRARIVCRRPAAGRGPLDGRRVLGRAGRARRFRAGLFPLVRRAAGSVRRDYRAPPCGCVLARMGSDVPLRRTVARCGRALAADAQIADRCAHGRRLGGADDLTPGVHRRRAQLGLPLLLVARRDVRAGRAAQRRLRGRSVRVARLAAARSRRKPGSDPDPLRFARRAANPRVRGAVAARLRRFATGPDRQRGGRAAATRRLRRGRGRDVPGAPGRARRRMPTSGR